MNDQQLSSLLVLLVPCVVKEIVNHENLPEELAVEQFYYSQLYEDLENEQTKLWHLSPKALYELYHQEKNNRKNHLSGGGIMA